MDLTTTVTVIITAACMMVLAVKIAALRRGPGRPARLIICFFLAALTVDIGIQPIVLWLDRLCGVQKLGDFIGELAGVIAAGSGQIFRIRAYYARDMARAKLRLPYWMLASTCTLMVVLFVLGSRDSHLLAGETHSSAGHLGVLPLPYLYWYPYSLYLGVTFTSLIALCIRHAPSAPRTDIRASLYTLAAGCAVAFGYTIVSCVMLTLRELGKNVDTWEISVAPLYLTADLLLLLGCAIPAIAPRLAEAMGWLADYRAERRLYPLWLALYRSNPDIALFSEPTRTWRRNRTELRMSLYRKAIEIRDGELALRPYLDPAIIRTTATRCQHAGMNSNHAAATAEAVAIAAAIDAKSTGIPPPISASPTTFPTGGVDLAAEVASLRRVARAFGRGTAGAQSNAAKDAAHGGRGTPETPVSVAATNQ